MPTATSNADPYYLTDVRYNGATKGAYITPVGRALRSQTINTGIRNLVYISTGQSNRAGSVPTLYAPSNPSAIDNFNVYDGAMYDVAGPMLGATNEDATHPGNVCPMVADKLITNNKFDRVILVTLGWGGTYIVDWTPRGWRGSAVPVAMRRLAARGIVPGMSNVTFCLELGLGESDAITPTPQAVWQAQFAEFKTLVNSTGFNGRFFVPQQTWLSGVTNATIRAAQAAVVDGVTVFSGGDIDTLDNTNRQADLTHFTDAGAAAEATIMYNAMVASGAPY